MPVIASDISGSSNGAMVQSLEDRHASRGSRTLSQLQAHVVAADDHERGRELASADRDTVRIPGIASASNTGLAAMDPRSSQPAVSQQNTTDHALRWAVEHARVPLAF